MENNQLAEQIAEKHLGKVSWKLYGERQKQQILAAIVEAMDAPAKEGMKWVKASERLPEKGKQVFWNRHEEYPVWGRYSQDGGFHDLVTIDSSGEEEAEPINYDWEWLDESAPAKEAISDSEVRDEKLHIAKLQAAYAIEQGHGLEAAVHFREGYLAAKEAISVPAQQPSLEEKKEDLVASSSATSTVPCVTPLYDNNSIQQ
jgi:hypothetical protein